MFAPDECVRVANLVCTLRNIDLRNQLFKIVADVGVGIVVNLV